METARGRPGGHLSVSGPPSPDLLARCHRNLVAGAWDLVKCGPRPRRKDWPGATAISNAIPSSVCNTLLVVEAAADVPAIVAEAHAFFGRRVPWKVVATPDTRSTVERVSTSAHFRAGETVPGMVLDPLPSAPAPPSELKIVEATDERSLRDFRHAGGIGFRIPRWILRVAIPSLPERSAGSGGGARFFVGYFDGRPVTTSALYVSEGLAGIFFVATLPAFRRKGYGAAMTWAALEASRGDGGRIGFLQATAMGNPVYQRMGFRAVTEYPEWHAPFPGARIPAAVFRMIGLALSRGS